LLSTHFSGVPSALGPWPLQVVFALHRDRMTGCSCPSP
jgi:hypothetical protein